MTNKEKSTITFSSQVKTIKWIDKLAKIENKTREQLIEDILNLYSMKVINRAVHEVRVEEISGKDCSGLSDEEIDVTIDEILCGKN